MEKLSFEQMGIITGGSILPSPSKPSEITEEFQIRCENSIDPYGLEQLLSNTMKKYEPFNLRIKRKGVEHEWGVGGRNETTFEIIDAEGNVYLFLSIKNHWSTTSDDSTDYREPTVVSLRTHKPLFNNVAEEIIQRLEEYKIV